MKKIEKFILSLTFCLVAMSSFAQVSASFENRNGYTYAVLANNGSYTVTIAWRCANYQLGQWRDGSINLQPGYETCIGPNVGWTWQLGEEFIYQIAGASQTNITFRGTPQNSPSDGYIHKGRITLYRVGSGQGKTFELYVKSSTRYVEYKGRYYKIDGAQYVTIDNVKYKTR